MAPNWVAVHVPKWMLVHGLARSMVRVRVGVFTSRTVNAAVVHCDRTLESGQPNHQIEVSTDSPVGPRPRCS